MLKQKNNTVIDLQKIRKLTEKKYLEESINKYLGILSFSQLMNETSSLIKDLNNNKLDSQVVLKSKLVFKQLGERLESQSSEYSDIVKEMKNNISDKIENLNSPK